MKTSILLISTSPRKGGNCDDAAKIVLDELTGKQCPAKSISLNRFNIERCRGCLNCQKGKKCPIDDDFPGLWDDVKQAETIVYFVPVYWCAPPGLMKDFIDRTVVDYQVDGGIMRGKQVHLVSIAQAAGFEPQEQIMDTWARWLGGSALKTKLRLIAFHTGELLKNASAVGKLKKLADGLVHS
jgi:multimeric flavodoxin WrbA